MSKRRACLGALLLKRWSVFGIGCLLFNAVFTGSRGEGQPYERETASRSLADPPLLREDFTAVLPLPLRSPLGTNMTENNERRRRSSSTTDTGGSVLPPNILMASHLSSLRDLISEKKIKVRIGLRVSLIGPRELLDPKVLLSLNKETRIFNTGENAGIFSLRIVRIQKVT